MGRPERQGMWQPRIGRIDRSCPQGTPAHRGGPCERPRGCVWYPDTNTSCGESVALLRRWKRAGGALVTTFDLPRSHDENLEGNSGHGRVRSALNRWRLERLS